MPFTRRRFLTFSLMGLGLVGTGYSYYRGLRFPPPVFTFGAPITRGHTENFEAVAQGASFQTAEKNTLRFRAFVPEPKVSIKSYSTEPWKLVMENIHRDAELEHSHSQIRERSNNLKRVLHAEPMSPQEYRVGWKLPNVESYRFAIIGDTGGGLELAWVLRRSAELGAKFLLHLGDIYYEKGDFERAIENFNNAEIPSYVAIGNHEFAEGIRLLYPKFNRLIGPNNSVFRLGGIEFVNFDTAAGFIPVARGQRARLFERLVHVKQSAEIRDRVCFTHIPLNDPDKDRDHAVSALEVDWLREQILSRGSNKLFAGHIHIKEEFDDQGLKTYISGQGLAHADLLVQRPYAEILMGEVIPGKPVAYQWNPLNMPYEMHCNVRNVYIPEVSGRPEETRRLKKICGKT